MNLRRLYYIFKCRMMLYRLWSYNEVRGAFPRCYIFLAADYGNLGDIAITLAQKRFLKERFQEHEVVEVPATMSLRMIPTIRKSIRPEDIITVVGGGNMGDMYGDIELLRLMVVKVFRGNRVILFPQTIDYSNSTDAVWLQKLSQRVYQSHPLLTMAARERHSYHTMRSLYPGVNTLLTPDIVMNLNERDAYTTRENLATLCLRNDLEKVDHSALLQDIEIQIRTIGLAIEMCDTHIGSGRYSEKDKYTALERIWEQFRRSRLVVTDRLHGMIFAYITGTPALVLPNSNFKISGCYEWIRHCGYIRLLSSHESRVNVAEILRAEFEDNGTQNNIIRELDKLI